MDYVRTVVSRDLERFVVASANTGCGIGAAAVNVTQQVLSDVVLVGGVVRRSKIRQMYI